MTFILRVLAVDDEPIALDRLSDMLARIEGVNLVGTEQNGHDALEAVHKLRPDLLLLDIEMPLLDGFDVVEALIRANGHETFAAPLICFVTAYPQFASDAFDTGALDFLSKPVRLPRLEKAVERARTALEQREAARRLAELSVQLERLREARAPVSEPELWVHRRGELIKLDPNALAWVRAEGEYVRLHTHDASYLLRKSMTEVCDVLEDYGLTRIHRSAAINWRRVRAIRRSRSGAKVVLDNGLELPIGRKYRKSVEEQLTG